jgi:hypothetical protein
MAPSKPGQRGERRARSHESRRPRQWLGRGSLQLVARAIRGQPCSNSRPCQPSSAPRRRGRIVDYRPTVGLPQELQEGSAEPADALTAGGSWSIPHGCSRTARAPVRRTSDCTGLDSYDTRHIQTRSSPERGARRRHERRRLTWLGVIVTLVGRSRTAVIQIRTAWTGDGVRSAHGLRQGSAAGLGFQLRRGRGESIPVGEVCAPPAGRPGRDGPARVRPTRPRR